MSVVKGIPTLFQALDAERFNSLKQSVDARHKEKSEKGGGPSNKTSPDKKTTPKKTTPKKTTPKKVILPVVTYINYILLRRAVF